VKEIEKAEIVVESLAGRLVTDEHREALANALDALVAFWDAERVIERLIGYDIDNMRDQLGDMAACHDIGSNISDEDALLFYEWCEKQQQD
jgi:hypothetical protein